jgi:hypothetical protein
MPEIGISISTSIPSSKIAGYTMTYSITVYNNNPVPVRCRLSYDQDGGVNDIAVSANSSTTFTTSYYNTSLEGRPTSDIVTAYFYLKPARILPPQESGDSRRRDESRRN